MTVSEAHACALGELSAAGFERPEAALIARLLVDKYAGDSYAHLKQPDAPFSDGLGNERFALALHRLLSGYPLAYLLGKREFYGLDFKCDERALVPRPDTETLVEAAIERLKTISNPLVADLGTGTGCIALSMAHALPASTVHATDASPAALELAAENAAEINEGSRIVFFRGLPREWALPLVNQGRGGAYHAVLTNPPYISLEDIETLQPQIRGHEPLIALDGGVDGLSCYREIAAQCAILLAPGGFLMAELGAGQFVAVRKIFRENGWGVAEPILDLAGIERVLVATRTRTA